ncbi:MAG: hypothetical protein ABI637_00615 [Gemmatimonadota bacterium]
MSDVRTLALPFRITPDGQLARSDGASAVLRLIQAMVASTAASWPHARWFGLHERFLSVNADVEDQAGLADALNDALQQLGVTWARVQHVRSIRGGAAYGERRFDISLMIGDDTQPVSAAVTA